MPNNMIVITKNRFVIGNTNVVILNNMIAFINNMIVIGRNNIVFLQNKPAIGYCAAKHNYFIIKIFRRSGFGL